MTDRRDEILQRHSPMVLVPRHGTFEPLAANGHRYLAASNGLWLEVRRPWLYLRQLIAESVIDLPYGDIDMALRFAWERWELEQLIERFRSDAELALPAECAAWGIWNTTFGRLHYEPIAPTDATPGSVTFERPRLAAHEHFAVDLHSHGRLAAGFSATDDADDAGEVKLAIVLGEPHAREPSHAVRLCAHGLFLEVA